MKPQKTKHEILDDVVAHIKNQGGCAINPNNFCVYRTKDGKTCGHSMALNQSKVIKVGGLVDMNATSVIEEYGDEIHLVKYRGHEPDFWIDVQEFHDTSENWTEKGEITTKGVLRLEQLKREWRD